MISKARRKWLLPLLRYGLCVAAIAWLVYNVPWHDRVTLADAEQTCVRLIEERENTLVIERDGRREVITYDQVLHDEQGNPQIELGIPNVVLRVDKRMALLAIAIFLPTWFIQSYRLVVMLAIQGLRLRYWNAIKLTYAGNFFNFALPGTTGGDLIKAYYVSLYTHRKTEAVTTVFLDRAIGLLSIVILATIGIIVRWDPGEFDYLIIVLAIVFGSLAVGIVVVFSRRVRRVLRLSELAERLPGAQQLLRIGRATVAMRSHKLRVIVSLALSLALQSIVMISAAVMAREALGMRGELSYYFIYCAIGFLIAAIPISPPQAIGIMEAAYVKFFTFSGLASPSQAVALALAVRLTQLVHALPGVLVPLLGAHLPSKTELAHLEAEAALEDGNDAGRTSAAGSTVDLEPGAVASSASQE